VAPPTASAWATYRRLLTYLKPERRWLWLALVGMVIDAAAHGAFTQLMKPLLDSFAPTQLVSPELKAQLPLLIVALFLGRGAANFVADYGLLRVGRVVVRDLRAALHQKYLRLPTAFFDASASGQLIAQATYHVEQVAQASAQALTVLVRDSLTIVVLIGVMVYNSWRLTLALLIMMPLVAVIVWYVNRRVRRLAHKIQDSMSEVTQATEEVVAGQRLVKVYGAQALEAERFRITNQRNLELNLKLASTDALSGSVIQLTAACALAGIVYAATFDNARSGLTPGGFMAVIGAMMLILPSLKRLSTVQSVLGRGIAAARALFEVLDLPDEADPGRVDIDRVRGAVTFRAVSFAYADTPILSDLSFEAPAGSLTAIVGRSGSGKSSLVSLLARFYAPMSGVIELDGLPLDQYTLASLRRQIALVDQAQVLFNASIERNVAFGELSGASQTALREALEAAHALEFVDPLAQGVGSPVGERGGMLSGGQRQRLAIARAILKDAPILILDEATSALDTRSERAIQDALDTVMRERTTFVIAHRLSTVERADQILVLERGQIVERGTHRELLARDGVYAALHQVQFRDDPAP
jgi:ATP-binding cassette, subfamily B, bacterial MsbA